ncbi:hypothetical protein PFISCL1PPCAC_22575 [Pristionchus fissidentatus]|uniref:G protein-coupled receptor n=1 Tax=Pristionchus fissidentatus TaxID=1538716 RepID=A0AAV5WIM8_9BILA|nr:hypothetical protein PFISCL1PPCAC_22575 [Pristionchus fissidentatus]
MSHAQTTTNMREKFDTEDDDDGEYVPKCCCCDSPDFVRLFGLISTLFAIAAWRVRMEDAVKESLVVDSFDKLVLDHMKVQAVVIVFCPLSMITVSIAFSTKTSKWLYAPILMHSAIVVCYIVVAVQIFFYQAIGNQLMKLMFTHRLDDLAFDYPDREYKELHAYLMQVSDNEIRMGGMITAALIPFHCAFVVVCWRLRNYLEMKKAGERAMEEEKEKRRKIKAQ